MAVHLGAKECKATIIETVTAIQGGKALKESINDIYNSTQKYQILQKKLEDFPLDSDAILCDTPASLVQ